MIQVAVKFGGKDGKKVWKLVEAPQLLAVRTRTRQPLDRLRFRDPSHNKILDYDCRLTAALAGVEVRDVNQAKTRNDFRKSLAAEPDVQFAGRVLCTADGGIPVLYTENLFVKFGDRVAETTCLGVLDKHGLIVTRKLEFARNAFFVRTPEGTGLKVFEKQEELFKENAVELCHPELVMEKDKRVANSNQWHLKRAIFGAQIIEQHAAVEDAWAFSTGRDVTIAVIDDGFDLRHPEFGAAGKIVSPRDVSRQTDDPRPGPGDNHGTACAGVACAAGTGAPGASGVAPEARLMPIRSVSLLGSVEEAEAFYHAANEGADVIACSWGPQDGEWWNAADPRHAAVVPLPDSTRLAIEYCIQKGRKGKGCVITWAAGNGNENADNDGYASYEKVIGVAACNDRGVKSDYSDYGDSVWCAFPSSQGEGGLTTGIWTVDRRGASGYNLGHSQLGDPAGNYTNDFGGTSSACPGAAGVAALVLSVNPDLTWSQVRKLLAETADKIDPAGGHYDANGHSKLYGHGRLNAKRAVEKAISMGGKAKPAPLLLPQDGVEKSEPSPLLMAPPDTGEPCGDLIAAYVALLTLNAKNLAALLERKGGSRSREVQSVTTRVVTVIINAGALGPLTLQSTLAGLGFASATQVGALAGDLADEFGLNANSLVGKISASTTVSAVISSIEKML